MRERTRAILVLLVVCLGGCAEEPKSPLFIQLEKLAQAGNPEAQYHLGMMYNNGIGVNQDPGKAFALFSDAADSDEPLASYKVGCYYGGQFGVVQPDREKSLQYKLIAANAGYSFAQSDVGNMYFENGSYSEAIKWWKLATAQGYPQALGNLSLAFREGKIVSQDKVLAYAYFKLANIGSDQKLSADAQNELDKIAETMNPNELEQAEKVVSNWRPEPTPLTLKALSGLEEAKRLIDDSEKIH